VELQTSSSAVRLPVLAVALLPVVAAEQARAAETRSGALFRRDSSATAQAGNSPQRRVYSGVTRPSLPTGVAAILSD